MTLDDERDHYLNEIKLFREQLMKIQNDISKMWGSFYSLETSAKFYFNHLIESEKGYSIHFPKDVINQEDLLLSNSLEIIKRYHEVDVDRIDFHKRIDGIEFDCLIRCHKINSGLKYIINIEFKDTDIDKVISQAHKRNSFVNMQYVVVGSSPKWILYDRFDKVKELFEHGIGLICMQYEKSIALNMADETPVMISKSDIIRSPTEQQKLGD
jgi:hypothetical protein